MIHKKRFPLRSCVVALSIAGSAPAAAQGIGAEALFDRGLADMEAGRYEAGCKAIAESQRLDPRPGTLFTLATCEQRWGHAATALALFGDYLALYERLPDDKKVKQGERLKVARMQRDKLALEIKAAPPEVVLPPAPVAAPPAPVLVAPPLRDAGPSGRRIAAFVTGGVGVAGLAVGGVMGGLALREKGIVDRSCGSAIGSKDPTACHQEGLDAASRARTMGVGSTVGLAAGLAAVGGAAILILTEPRHSTSVGVISVGPAGGVIGVTGAW